MEAGGLSMDAIDPVYEEGVAAGRAGMGPEANPYVREQLPKPIYAQTRHDRWEAGRQRGRRWCPHCNGTGQLPEGV